MFIANLWCVPALMISFAYSESEVERLARRRLFETGINSTVGFALLNWCFVDLVYSDNRHQPPGPVNASMMDLLAMIKTSTDPWLLFLYVQALAC